MESAALPERARELVEFNEHEVFASAVSIWEAAIKYRLRRGGPNDMPMSGRQLLEALEATDADLLAITGTHTAAVDDLPLLHGDPFDRLLIAQARVEAMHLLTHEKRLAEYGDHVIVV